MTTNNASPPPEGVIIVLCNAAMIVLAIAVNLHPVFLTSFSEAFGGAGGLNEEQMGRVPAALFFSLIVSILFTGPLADRVGAKPVTLAGLGLIGLGLVLMATAQQFWVLLVSAALLGIGVGKLEVVLSPIVSVLHPARRAAALNRLHLYYCAGAVLATVVTAAGFYVNISWRVLCGGLVTLPVLVFIGFSLVRLPPLTQETGERDPVRRLIRVPMFLLALVGIALAGATEVGMATWLPTFAERSIGDSKVAGGLALGAFSLAMAMGRGLASLAVHRFSPYRVMQFFCVASVALYLLAGFVAQPHIALVAAMGIGLTAGCLWPTMLAITADRFPMGGASMFGVLAAAGNVGCVTMPWVMGFIAKGQSLNLGIAVNAASPLLMIALLAWMLRDWRARNTSDS
jgi:fucose permease